MASYDKEKLRKVVIAALSQNEIIFDNWAIGEIASGIEKFDISKYETHLSKVFDLTLKALEQTTSVKTVQTGGGFPIKVIILSIIFGIFYGFLNHEVANQIDKGFIEIQDEIITASNKMGGMRAKNLEFVLKNLPGNVISNSCNLYDPNTAKFIENKPENLEIKLIDQPVTNNMNMVEKAIVEYKPQSFSNSKGKELTEFTTVFQCQSKNIAIAIEQDAKNFALEMYKEITQDTTTPTFKEKILSGFGLLANPTDTATVGMDKVKHSMDQAQRRLAIQYDQAKILNTRFQILVSNINNIVKTRGLNIRNLVIAKQFAGAISLAGVKYLAPGVPIGEFTASGLTQKLASGITYEGLNLLEDRNDKKGGKKRKRKTKKNKKNKKKTKKAKKSKKKKNKKSKKTKKARKKRR